MPYRDGIDRGDDNSRAPYTQRPFVMRKNKHASDTKTSNKIKDKEFLKQLKKSEVYLPQPPNGPQPPPQPALFRIWPAPLLPKPLAMLARPIAGMPFMNSFLPMRFSHLPNLFRALPAPKSLGWAGVRTPANWSDRVAWSSACASWDSCNFLPFPFHVAYARPGMGPAVARARPLSPKIWAIPWTKGWRFGIPCWSWKNPPCPKPPNC